MYKFELLDSKNEKSKWLDSLKLLSEKYQDVYFLPEYFDMNKLNFEALHKHTINLYDYLVDKLNVPKEQILSDVLSRDTVGDAFFSRYNFEKIFLYPFLMKLPYLRFYDYYMYLSY